LRQILISHVDDAVQQDVAKHREAFVNARPFKHNSIENFFEQSFAERLLAEFPSFDKKLAINELGDVGGKAVNTKIRQISPAYEELYALIGSSEFLNLASELTGIPDLVMDPLMYGGGTHENLHGQELDAHVDFNYDQTEKLHRRLNLIVYLNKEWQTSWGGAIEIHSNPRKPYENQIHAFDPIFNRAVMFETNEYSWHGFERINLPENKQHLSRKSISIYLYTKDRPKEEIAPPHGTFYVQRFLPKSIVQGHTLTADDVVELSNLLVKRDAMIEFYHKMELRKNAEAQGHDYAIRELRNAVRAPITGYLRQTQAADGLSADDWVAPHVAISLEPTEPVSEIYIRGWRADAAPAGKVRLAVGSHFSETNVGGAFFEAKLKFPKPLTQPFVLNIDTEAPGNGLPPSSDPRPLAFRLMELRASHPKG
jgi:Rps23 Pro-64 3,4-dihydroxylase Tpa1-like proline 4-hydroxylase